MPAVRSRRPYRQIRSAKFIGAGNSGGLAADSVAIGAMAHGEVKSVYDGWKPTIFATCARES
jgi:hypothetical protein